ncbi:hypothetical protein ACFPC0_10575 [Streptomyces andamanensis]|uniref:Uncharacterized protein n=1 Tax=Streptomyces andamanensis TaxID=1565035 RepID=A0ABV8TCE8_9ACTN
MKMDELAALAAQRETAGTLLEAIGQRVVCQPDARWDWESEAALCECGLLLVELPRPVVLERAVVTMGRSLPVSYEMTHAHVADGAGRLLCPDCADAGEACGEPHEALMCDTPTPRPCRSCSAAALPNQDHCIECRPYEEQYDSDRYYGIYL